MGLRLPRKLLAKLLGRKPATQRVRPRLAQAVTARPSQSVRRHGYDGERKSSWLTAQFPLVLVSEPNQRGHWTKRYRRSSGQRNHVVAYELLALRRAFEQLADLPLDRRLRVTLTRIGPKELDDDNLRGAFKAVRDEVARFLGVDDADPRVAWRYGQEPDGRPLGQTEIRIMFETVRDGLTEGIS